MDSYTSNDYMESPAYIMDSMIYCRLDLEAMMSLEAKLFGCNTLFNNLFLMLCFGF